MEQGDAQTVNHMIDAAHEYGVVPSRCAWWRTLFHGQLLLSPEDKKLMYLASVAHPLAIQRRGGA